MEARGFRDRAPDLARMGVEILGISFDSQDDMHEFARREGLPFRLLSADRAVGEAYGAARRPTERPAQYARRLTYVIDPDGRIAAAYRVDDAASHADELVLAMRRLTSSAAE